MTDVRWWQLCIIHNYSHNRFTIPVKTEDFDEEERNGEGLWVLLKFTFPDKYPDEAPEVEIEEEEIVILWWSTMLQIVWCSSS